MNLYKKLLSLLLCFIIILSFTACNSTDKAYIYFNLTEKPNTLDPQIAKTDTELMIVRNIFEGLMRKDAEGNIVCGAAEKYIKDGLTYTFYLREGLTWSDETPLTAHDFVFGLRRAINPKTKAPFALRLVSIKNANAILNGKTDINNLAVEAIDDKTLKISLEKEDTNFLETLSTSVAMPCKESFFNETVGKYGLDTETTLSNGSYRLAKWGKDIFGIRLYRNDYYKGIFKAQNSAVFFSCDQNKTSIEVMEANDADISFIKSSEISKAQKKGFNTKSYNNIIWFLTISDGFSKDIRKSLISLSSSNVFVNNLTDGYYPAKSIYPNIICSDTMPGGMTAYDLETSKKLFTNAVNNLKDKKFPTDVKLYYYDDSTSKNIVTDIVAHWQNQLSAFVNIESVSSPQILLSQLKDQTYGMTIFPVIVTSNNTAEYLKNFGINFNGENLNNIQSKLLESKNITPLFTQDTVIAYSKKLSDIKLDNGNGCIDFAYIVKDE